MLKKNFLLSDKESTLYQHFLQVTKGNQHRENQD